MSHRVLTASCVLTILCLSLIPTSFLVNQVAGSTGLYVVAYNPYAGINWSATFRLKTQLHAHTNLGGGNLQPWTVINDYAAVGFNALGISDTNRLTWPWTLWEEHLTPAAWNMTPIQNDEVETSTAHMVAPFIASGVDGSLYGTDMQSAINAVVAVGGLPFISHPAGYPLTSVASWTGFQGIEIYDRRAEGAGLQPNNFQLWDYLLTDPVRSQKHVWGIAVDDSIWADQINRAWIVVYASQNSSASMKESIVAGSFVAVVNGTVSINSITQVSNTLIVDTSSSVVWKADGQKTVGTSTTLDLDTLGPGYTYVRAEVNDGAGVVFTQPIFIMQASQHTIFSNGFEDGFASWDNTVTNGSGWIGARTDTAHSGLYSEKIAAIDSYGDRAFANKSIGAALKRVNIRGYVNFWDVSTTGWIVGPLVLNSWNGYPNRAAVVWDFAQNKWGIRVYNPIAGKPTWYWQSGNSTLATNTWYCVELEAVMSVHGFSTLWIDGEMKLNVTDFNFADSWLTSFAAGEWYTMNTTSGFVKYYVDDVVVADSYIGPIQYGLTVRASGPGTTNATGTSMYVENTNVTVLATAYTGANFTHWLLNGTNVGSTNPYTITMTANYNLTAVFTSIPYSLNVSTVGSGSVALNNTGPYYYYGDVVELTAIPDAGWRFDHWEGDLTGSANPDAITIDGNEVVTANFVPLNYTLNVTVSPPEGGSVARNNTGPYHYGDWVRLTALQNEHYVFSNWSGDASGTLVQADVFIDGNKSVVANFDHTGAILTVTWSGNGVTNVTGTNVYMRNTNVTVLATPDSGWMLDHWILNRENIGSANPYTLNMTTDYTLEAVFLPIQYALTVETPEYGSTNATGIHKYDAFTNVSVLATPDLGYWFDHWILNGSIVGSVNPYTLNMTANYNLTAVFTLGQYDLYVGIVGNGVANATGTQTYPGLTDVSVLATPDPNYYLVEWLLNGTSVGSANPYTVTMVHNYNLTAVFARNQRSLTVSKTGQGNTNATGTVMYDQFSNVTVLATPDSGWVFDHWTLNGTNIGSANPYTLNMTANYELTAFFTQMQYSYLVVRGADNRIYYRIYNSSNTSWGDWNALPEGATYDTPAAAVYSGKLYFVVRGMDGYSMWFSWINLTDYSFSGWTWISGATESQPTLTSYNAQLILVVRGTDNSIYYRFYDCIADMWGDWAAVPTGSTPDIPGVAALGDGLHFVVRGMDGYSMWHSWINLTDYTFSGWTSISGSTPSRPVLTASQSLNKLYLVVRGSDDGIYLIEYDGSGNSWGSWTGLPGATTDSPAAVVVQNQLHIVVRGADGNSLWHWDGSRWNAIDGSTPSPPTLAS